MKVLSSLLDNRKKKKIRERFMQENLLNKIDLTKPYIYFPMSTDLERHLQIDSPFYTNQIEVIRHVAKSLPVGHLLYVKENPARAVKELKSALKIDNSFVLAHYDLGAAYQSQGLLENAIKEYEKAIALNPAFQEGSSNLGGYYFRLQKYEQAVEP